MNIKEFIRKVCIYFHFDLTKNLKYDRLTQNILKERLQKESCCIDIGAHKGDILDIILRYAPDGKHIAFEPIPELYRQLIEKYQEKATIYAYALGKEEGIQNFNFVKNAPAYSGLKIRQYAIAHPIIENIEVEVRTLDSLISNEWHIDFIKIDVEGGEFDVLQGAVATLQRCRPLILFEYGKGAGDYYGTSPKDIYELITQKIGMNIYTLSAFLHHQKPLSLEVLSHYFHSGKEYYFVASQQGR